MSEAKIETIKCLLVGDCQVGKSSLLQTLATGIYPVDFVPSYHDKCSFYVDLDENSTLNSNSNALVIELSDYEAAVEGSLNLNDFNVVLLCFSFDNKDSFESVKSNWLTIVENFNKNLAKNSDKCLSYVLLGLKSDLVDEECVSTFQRSSSIRRSTSKKGKIFPNVGHEAIKKCNFDNFEKYSKKIGACDYIEISAKETAAEPEDFAEKLNSFLEKIYKSYYLNNVNSNKKLKKFLDKFGNSAPAYSRLQAPIQIPKPKSQQVESVKFKFVNLLRRCSKYVFSCTSSKYAEDGCMEKYQNLERPSKLRNSNKLLKFPSQRNKNMKLVNAESTVTLDIENDDVFY